jgi:hypothetical protein
MAHFSTALAFGNKKPDPSIPNPLGFICLSRESRQQILKTNFAGKRG